MLEHITYPCIKYAIKISVPLNIVHSLNTRFPIILTFTT